jgi:predicted NBD/HSP70 family sugar kinase
MANGNSATLTRRYNRTVVLDALRRHGSLSRIELARLSGLTPQGIRNIIEDLIDTGLVRETGRRRGLRGQPQIDIEINPGAGYCLGLHVASGLCHAIATDLAGNVLARAEARAFGGDHGQQLDALGAIARTVDAAAGGLPRLGTGVVVSRPLASRWSAAGGLADAQADFAKPFEALFASAPLVFENDANAAAMAEYTHGRAKGRGDFLYLFLGEGVGGAIVQGGVPMHGGRGNAGEFGHILIDPRGAPCHCGNRGCLHGYLALDGLRPLLPAGAMLAQDNLPQTWLDGAASALSRALVSLENIFDPQAIVLGGTAPAWLLHRLVETMGDPGPSVRSDVAEPRIEVSGLGQSCALIGAAALPLLALTSPDPATLMKEPSAETAAD